MAINLQGKSFLKLLDFSTEEILYLLDLSKEFKKILFYYLKKLLQEQDVHLRLLGMT